MNNKMTATAIFAGVLAATTALADGTNNFKDDKEKYSYAIGLNFGNNWKQQELEVDYEMLVRGLKEAKAGGTTLLTEQEARDTLNKLSQELRTKAQERQRLAGEKNKKDGEAFLAANKDKEGVITLPSGLQYKILTDGKGESPKPEDTVLVNYRGSLIDGTEFDSSTKAGGKPISFKANGVIKGWTEALTRMKPGSKWQLFIPADLAYGEYGRPPKIGPNSTLLFDVELISFESAPPPPAPAPAAAPAPLTSDIIKVPSLEEMKKGAKIETIPASEVERLQKQAQTNAPPKEEKK
jgi:FKBP-type peptidyl-prolyl cis-trans isomerase FklB